MTPAASDELTTLINRRLLEDIRLAPYAIKARVYENGLVQIQGIVDVLSEKSQAEELVRKIPGVKKVENDITVCTDGAIDDEDVAFEISEELHANPNVPDSVGALVSGGEARLVGKVANVAEAQEAIATAAKARGVRDIRSELTLEPDIDVVTLTNNIQTALMDELGLVPGKVKIQNDNGVITIWGDIPTDQVKTVTDIVARQPGVKKVRNAVIELN